MPCWAIKDGVFYMPYLDEAQVEIQMIEWLKELDYDYVYGPDKQENATQTVLKQAELLCQDWAA